MKARGGVFYIYDGFSLIYLYREHVSPNMLRVPLHCKSNLINTHADRSQRCTIPSETPCSPTHQTPAGVSRASSHRRDFMDTPRGPEGMSGVPGTGGSTSSSSSSSTSSSSYTSMRPEEGPKEKQEAPEAEYLTSRCVLFTYYQGDISSVVDEHFSRALSSYMDGEGKRRPTEQGSGRHSSLFLPAIC